MSSAFGALRRLTGSALSLARTRIELAGVELADERDRLLHVALLALFGGVCVALALIAATVLVAVVFWDSARLQALVALIAVWAAIGTWLLLRARRLMRDAPGPLSATLGELRSDLDALRQAVGGDSA